MSGLFTVTEVAEMADVSKGVVRALCRAGAVPARQLANGYWVLNQDAVDAVCALGCEEDDEVEVVACDECGDDFEEEEEDEEFDDE